MQDKLQKFSEQCRHHDHEYALMKDEWEQEDEHSTVETLAYLCDMVSLLHERHECLANVVQEHLHVFHNVPRGTYASLTEAHIG